MVMDACSGDTNMLWIGITNAGGEADVMLTIAVSTRTVTTQKLAFPMFASLWAYCDDEDPSLTVSGNIPLVMASFCKEPDEGELGGRV